VNVVQKYSSETALNIIFAGTLVHLKHYGKEPRVNSPMQENRLFHYMDESNMIVNKERINLLKSMLMDII
jgi:hypothetical protein|tara:strand:- start:467 stop:676 length:210 start_codon:yes stop_codon:yes gene_type:complete